MSELNNLETTKTHAFQAHMDRIKNTELELAKIMAGEVLAGRQATAAAMARNITGIRICREELIDIYNKVNGIQSA